jgi:hypothetical protein
MCPLYYLCQEYVNVYLSEVLYYITSLQFGADISTPLLWSGLVDSFLSSHLPWLWRAAKFLYYFLAWYVLTFYMTHLILTHSVCP